MATTPLNPTAMPIDQFGATIKAKHPEYADLPDAELGQKVLDKYPQYQDMVAPSLPAHPAVSMTKAPSSLRDQVQDVVEQGVPNAPHRGESGMEEAGRMTYNAGARSVRSLSSLVTHPESLITGPLRIAREAVDPTNITGPHATPLSDQAQSYIDTAHRDPHQAISDVGSDLVTGAVLGKVLPPAISAAGGLGADVLNATGRGLKRVGALTSRVATGAPSPDVTLGADVGAGLSENRVVGMSPKSLKAKVAATVGPASAARDSVLSQSQAAPVDVTPGVEAPFDAIRAAKTHPTTGAAQPRSLSNLTTTQRALTEQVDPMSGSPTGTPKDLTQLTPSQMAELGKNVYSMTDYNSPDSTLSNQALKGAGAHLKEQIDLAAPEARPLTRNVHNLLEAEDLFKSQSQGATGIPTDKSGVISHAVTGAGTAAGAGLDMLGSGLMKAGGVLRRFSSPVAPTPPPGGTGAGGPAPPVRAQVAPGGLPAPPYTPPQVPAVSAGGLGVGPTLRGQLGQTSTVMGTTPRVPTGIPHPGAVPDEFARTRVTPTELPPRSQQAVEGTPGFTPPKGNRRLIVGPDGKVAPEPIPLAAPTPTPQLESATGRRAPSALAARPKLMERLHQEATTPQYAPPAADRPGSNVLIRKPIPSNKTEVHGTGASQKGNNLRMMDAPLPDRDTNEDAYVAEVVKPHKDRYLSTVNGFGPRVSVPDDASLRAELTKRLGREDADEAFDHLTSEGAYEAVPNEMMELDRSNAPAAHSGMDLLSGMIDKAQDLADNNTAPVRLTDKVSRMGSKPKDTLAEVVARTKQRKDASLPYVQTPVARGLPAPDDIDGWERLVDQGHAHYDVHTHSYRYTGPTNLTSKVKNAIKPKQ